MKKLGLYFLGLLTIGILYITVVILFGKETKHLLCVQEGDFRESTVELSENITLVVDKPRWFDFRLGEISIRSGIRLFRINLFEETDNMLYLRSDREWNVVGSYLLDTDIFTSLSEDPIFYGHCEKFTPAFF